MRRIHACVRVCSTARYIHMVCALHLRPATNRAVRAGMPMHVLARSLQPAVQARQPATAAGQLACRAVASCLAARACMRSALLRPAQHTPPPRAMLPATLCCHHTMLEGSGDGHEDPYGGRCWELRPASCSLPVGQWANHPRPCRAVLLALPPPHSCAGGSRCLTLTLASQTIALACCRGNTSCGPGPVSVAVL